MPLSDIQNHIVQYPAKKRRASDGSLPQPAHRQQHEGAEDARHWREKFFALQQLRKTQSEMQFCTLAEESNKRERSLKQYIDHLETQVKQLRTQTTQITSTIPQEVQTELDQLRSTVGRQKHELMLYQLLTSATLSNVEASQKVACDCTVTNPETNVTSSFRLSPGSEDAFIKYEPLQNTELLPDFLHSAIEFESSQCPALMQNMLQSLFPEE